MYVSAVRRARRRIQVKSAWQYAIAQLPPQLLTVEAGFLCIVYITFGVDSTMRTGSCSRVTEFWSWISAAAEKRPVKWNKSACRRTRQSNRHYYSSIRDVS